MLIKICARNKVNFVVDKQIVLNKLNTELNKYRLIRIERQEAIHK